MTTTALTGSEAMWPVLALRLARSQVLGPETVTVQFLDNPPHPLISCQFELLF